MDDDVVYASILTRLGHSELQEQMNRVMEKELVSINRQMRHVSSSLTALKQLQAAAEHLRPSGDWLPRTLSIQLKSIKEIQNQLEIAMDIIVMEKKTKQRKRPVKRKIIEKEEEDEIVIGDEEENSFVESKMKVERIQEVDNGEEIVERDKSEVVDEEELGVEVLEVEAVGERAEVEGEIECGEENDHVVSEAYEKQQEGDDEEEVMDLEMVMVDGRMVAENLEVEVEIPTGCGNKIEDVKSESGKLPNELVRKPLDAIVHVKEEPVTFADVQTLSNDDGRNCRNDEAATKGVESPIKMEVKRELLGNFVVKLEVSQLTELAVELEVPDSESEDEFSPIQEVVAMLKKVKGPSQLARFPAVVAQLRAYLVDHKYLTVADEVNEYLFAHKCITNEEANVIGHTIENIISVAITLPKRPTVKAALYDLLATVEQLELTLGEVPELVRP